MRRSPLKVSIFVEGYFQTLMAADKYLNVLDLELTISPFLGQSGLCDLICISTDTFEKKHVYPR